MGRNDQLLRSFETKHSFELGPNAEQIIAEDLEPIQEQCQRTTEVEKQLAGTETLVTEKDKTHERRDLKQKEAKAQAQIDVLQEEHGSNLEV